MRSLYHSLFFAGLIFCAPLAQAMPHSSTNQVPVQLGMPAETNTASLLNSWDQTEPYKSPSNQPRVRPTAQIKRPNYQQLSSRPAKVSDRHRKMAFNYHPKAKKKHHAKSRKKSKRRKYQKLRL